jgi:hypothetical protein
LVVLRARLVRALSLCSLFAANSLVFDQCHQAVVLRAARGTHGQMHGDAGELGGGGLCAELGLDVAIEHPAGGPAAEVAVVEP